MKHVASKWGIAFFAIAAVTLWAGDGMAQIEWEKYPGNPVLDLGPPGAWDDDRIAGPNVIFDGSEYKMWYSGRDGSHYRIGLATSIDGTEWTKHTENPVLDLGSPGEWDDEGVGSSDVLYDGAEYKMWYSGDDGFTRRIGYATSIDGIVWNKYIANPVLGLGTPGEWDDSQVNASYTLFDGTQYNMWFNGHDGTTRRIGYATSMDGIIWSKFIENPVLNLGPRGTWDESAVLDPSVLYDGIEFEMWYRGHNEQTILAIGYATSVNGTGWTKHENNPVIEHGFEGSWDDEEVNNPRVLFDSFGYKMWYQGRGGDGSKRRFGYAISLPDCWDTDGDGSWDETCGGWDCDDTDSAINPSATEVCDDTIDQDCDGLIDDLDPDCFPEFILDLDASFSGGKLYLDFTMGTERQATWINYAILGYPGPLEFIHLWTIQVPAIVPPADIPLSFWFPSVGYAGIYSAIYAGGVQEIAVLEWVDTGK